MRNLIIAICCGVLSGCATLFGVPASQLDSANKQLAAASIQIEALALLTTDLVEGDVLSPSQGRAISTNLRTALEAVQTAKDAVEASGDPSQADTALEIATRSIEITLRLLQSFASGSTDAIFEKELFHDGGCYRENSLWRADCPSLS